MLLQHAGWVPSYEHGVNHMAATHDMMPVVLLLLRVCDTGCVAVVAGV